MFLRILTKFCHNGNVMIFIHIREICVVTAIEHLITLGTFIFDTTLLETYDPPIFNSPSFYPATFYPSSFYFYPYDFLPPTSFYPLYYIHMYDLK